MNPMDPNSLLSRHRIIIWIVLLTILLLLLLAMAAAKFGKPDPQIPDSKIEERISTNQTGAGKQ